VNIDDINKDLPEDIRVFLTQRVTKGFNSKSNCDARTYSYTLPSYTFTKKDETYDEKTYRLPAERLEELNKILNLYEGTKNFHNFTIKKAPHDPSCRRYMMKLECPQPFVPDNTEVEFARIRVKGQSFMLHQIRRMVGLVIAIMKGYAEPFTVTHAMEKEKMNIPQAPGLGLILENVHYDRYNKRYGGDGVHAALTYEAADEKVEEFFQKKIVTTIIDTELRDKSMENWVKKLKHHSFTNEPEEDKEDESGNLSD
jgi:tRNA pseudouridine38-40 synthase